MVGMEKEAYEFALGFFADKVDKAKVPYMAHLETVANEVQGPIARAVAYLYDVLEDTECTEDDLLQVFPLSVVERVKLLTRGSESYMSYIKNLSQDVICREVKKADLKHNADILRLPKISKKDLERIAKYHKAYYFLNSIQ